MDILCLFLVLTLSPEQLYAELLCPWGTVLDILQDGYAQNYVVPVVEPNAAGVNLNDLITSDGGIIRAGQTVEIPLGNSPMSGAAVNFDVIGAPVVTIRFLDEGGNDVIPALDEPIDDPTTAAHISNDIPVGFDDVSRIIIEFDEEYRRKRRNADLSFEDAEGIDMVSRSFLISNLSIRVCTTPATGQQQVSEPQQEDPLFIPPPEDGTALADPLSGGDGLLITDGGSDSKYVPREGK